MRTRALTQLNAFAQEEEKQDEQAPHGVEHVACDGRDPDLVLGVRGRVSDRPLPRPVASEPPCCKEDADGGENGKPHHDIEDTGNP